MTPVEKLLQVREKKQHVRAEESAGKVADSQSVRLALLARVKAGGISLADAQRQLKVIQDGAASNGQITRSQAYDRG